MPSPWTTADRRCGGGEMNDVTDECRDARCSTRTKRCRNMSTTEINLYSGFSVRHLHSLLSFGAARCPKVNVYCIAHRREAPLMRYRFPYVGADLRKPVLQPGISKHCETTVYHAICLFTPQISPGTHSSLTRGRVQAEWAWMPGSAPRWFTHPKTVTHPGTNRT